MVVVYGYMLIGKGYGQCVEYYGCGWWNGKWGGYGQLGGGNSLWIGCAGVDGDWFGSNPLVGFETEPEPINHSTVF
ncbi:MAG: hypothetical protein EZS28_053863 [Streblomastix strix]|uniref:Uncharacterized protein n=1 Tax=Streblomastix strix TaxID=222440 RepID=A0A5J4R0I8_9EUKA|nr:MAG: hypothetical protein EZS28_053863 [Streblomastix strix]